MAKNFL